MSSIKSAARKVICIGRNYADHITELKNARPARPFFFLKPPTSLLPPQSGPILRPAGVKLHYEVELALIIGGSHSEKQEPIRDLDPNSNPESIIESYALAIDLTARNLQDEAKKKGLPWTTAKGFDTFCPISEPIPKSKIPDPHDVTLWLSVNGQMRQEDSTALMLFRVPRLLAEISSVMSLERGDVVLTGTPKGVGEIKPGDVVRACVKVGGKEIEEANIEVEVQERVAGRWQAGET